MSLYNEVLEKIAAEENGKKLSKLKGALAGGALGAGLGAAGAAGATQVGKGGGISRLTQLKGALNRNPRKAIGAAVGGAALGAGAGALRAHLKNRKAEAAKTAAVQLGALGHPELAQAFTDMGDAEEKLATIELLAAKSEENGNGENGNGEASDDEKKNALMLKLKKKKGEQEAEKAAAAGFDPQSIAMGMLEDGLFEQLATEGRL